MTEPAPVVPEEVEGVIAVLDASSWVVANDAAALIRRLSEQVAGLANDSADYAVLCRALSEGIEIEGRPDQYAKIVVQSEPEDRDAGIVGSAVWLELEAGYEVCVSGTLARAEAAEARVADLEAAIAGIADDYMTSDRHHPGYVLIPTKKFEELRAASEGAQVAALKGGGVPEGWREALKTAYVTGASDLARYAGLPTDDLDEAGDDYAASAMLSASPPLPTEEGST